MKKIILTGGGTAGHVTPNIALVPKLKENNFQIKYVGSYNGMEKDLVLKQGLDYVGISSGKLRRYFSWQNFTDPFRVIKGYFEARKIMKRFKPDVVFSKGGFVSVPVVMAAHAYKIPTIIHESDMTPGLANKIAMRYATKVCHTFPETSKYLGDKAVFTGSPLREELFKGNKVTALNMCSFTTDKPVLLVVGGSLGAQKVNEAIRTALPELLKNFQVAHLCGKGKSDSTLENTSGYAQFEYISSEMKDFFAMADIIVSRAGSNSICEIAALNKPSVLIPLSANASRGDQILNANSFEKQGFCEIVDEDTMTTQLLVDTINKVYIKRDYYIESMKDSGLSNGVDTIISLIKDVTV